MFLAQAEQATERTVTRPTRRQRLVRPIEHHHAETARAQQPIRGLELGVRIGQQTDHQRLDIDPGLPAPQGMHATAIFSIFEEMLGNVARHAQATEVLIRVRATPGDLTLLVKDNGKGAPPSAFERTDAHGVMGMRERAGHHGGWLQIDSQPGQGTQVILSMPLDHAVLHEERAA